MGSAGHATRKRIVMKSSNKGDDYDVTLTSGALIIPDPQPDVKLRVISQLLVNSCSKSQRGT